MWTLPYLYKIKVIPIFEVQLNPDNSNPQGKSEKVRVSRSLSYRELETNGRKFVNGVCLHAV